MFENYIIPEEIMYRCPPYEDIIIADMKRNFIYAPIPKCANTAIKYAISGGKIDVKLLHAKESFPRLSEVPNEIKNLFIASAFKFVVVRNPFERILSAYIDKFILNQNDQTWKGVSNFIKIKIYSEISENSILEFKDFVNFICETPHEKMNEHWHSQSRLGMFDFIKYDIVIDFHDIQDKWRIIKDVIGIGILPTNEELQFPPTNSANLLREYYDSSIANKVYAKFKEDFERFGYSKHI